MSSVVSAPLLVSIVTPTLNQGPFIEDTIRSITSQRYAEYEHIVVDAGSTDQTLDILRRHEGSYPMHWTSEPDDGMYDGVNRGLRRAKGDILTYLNSDDLYFPWTLDVVVEAFQQNPDVDVVFGDALGLLDGSGLEDVRFQPDLGHSFYLRAGSLAQPAVFWRRRVYDEIGGFDARLHSVGDLDYWLRMGPTRRMLRVDEFLAVERDHAAAKRFAGSNDLAREARQTRSRHDGAPRWRRHLGFLVGRFHAWAARRMLWVRLVRASRAEGRGLSRPWGHFLSASSLTLSAGRVALAQIPWLGPRIAPGTINTGVDWRRPADCD